MSFSDEDMKELAELFRTCRMVGDYRVITMDGGNTYYKVYKNGAFEKI